VAGTERLPYGASPDLRSHRRRTAVRLESISAKNIRPHCSASKNKFRCIQKALSVYHPFSDQAWLANKHDGLCSSSFSWKPSILSDSATVSTGSSRTVTSGSKVLRERTDRYSGRSRHPAIHYSKRHPAEYLWLSPRARNHFRVDPNRTRSCSKGKLDFRFFHTDLPHS